jgi:hypothetical protein
MQRARAHHSDEVAEKQRGDDVLSRWDLTLRVVIAKQELAKEGKQTVLRTETM